MEFNIRNWFKRPKERDYSDVELFMMQINADVSDEVRSILSSLTSKEEEQLKALYSEIYNYKRVIGKKKDIDSLINNKLVLAAISANISNYNNTKKIFNFVKAWDNETYLPNGVKVVLKNQISYVEIVELEELYKKHNIYLKGVLKDKTSYYYANSRTFRNELTKAFGDASRTLSIILKAREIDNRKRVSKDLVDYIEKLLNKRDVDGRLLNEIIMYRIRNIDNDHVVEDTTLDDMFSLGLINTGNILAEGITTHYVKDIYDVLSLLKVNEPRYSGIVIMEIPNIYLDDNNNVIDEYSDKVYTNGEYIRINPDYIKGYIATNFDRCELYTRKEVLNQELDMPELKGKSK